MFNYIYIGPPRVLNFKANYAQHARDNKPGLEHVRHYGLRRGVVYPALLQALKGACGQSQNGSMCRKVKKQSTNVFVDNYESFRSIVLTVTMKPIKRHKPTDGE